jgi:hypothetical protein
LRFSKQHLGQLERECVAELESRTRSFVQGIEGCRSAADMVKAIDPVIDSATAFSDAATVCAAICLPP